MNAKQARNKIIKHLQNKGHEQVTITPRVVSYWWNVFNVALFRSRLHRPAEIVCRNFSNGYYGWCQGTIGDGSDVVIGIRTNIKTRHFLLTTLAHEMVHQWQLTHGINNAHNTHFYMWRDSLHALGIPLKLWVD